MTDTSLSRRLQAASVTVVLAACVAPLDAQQNIKWIGDGTLRGGVNGFPWGSAGVRYQVIAPKSLLGGPALVQDLFIAGGYVLRTGYEESDLDIVYDDIEIRMGMTSRDVVTDNWQKNNPDPVTVYRGPLRAAFKYGGWRALALPGSFAYAPSASHPHLCIEIIVYAVRGRPAGQDFYWTPTSSVRRAFAWNWVTNPRSPSTDALAAKMGILLGDGSFAVIADGCVSSTGTKVQIDGDPGSWPRLGKTFGVTLSGARPQTAAILMIGASDVRWGPIILPIDLGPAGAPGCFVWNDKTLSASAHTNVNGDSRVDLDIPPSTLLGGHFLCSWAVLDPGANALGWTTSNYMRLIIGK